MHAAITGIEYHLPEEILKTEDLSAMFPEWGVEKIDAKTGIHARHIAHDDECASDLATAAVRKLFRSGVCSPQEVDFLVLCTQSPDYLVPTTACLLQQRLGLSTNTGALDINLGCSGFVYGLGIAEGLIVTGQAQAILLITADTYSKFIDANDKSSRVIFGDGSAATFIEARENQSPFFGPFVYGTDGQGAENLIVPNSGTRRSAKHARFGSSETIDVDTPPRSLRMNGARIVDFALTAVPRCVRELLRKAGMEQEEVDLFVFHQANAFLLEELRKVLEIPIEKFVLAMAHCANTVSSTIPITLKEASKTTKLRDGDKVMLVGFGVGYSWGATLVRWTGI
jgi:3-oxoacyl-[acyl-carrier-protein] synthase-3